MRKILLVFFLIIAVSPLITFGQVLKQQPISTDTAPFENVINERIIHLTQNLILGGSQLLSFSGSPIISQEVNESDCWVGSSPLYACGQSFTLNEGHLIGGVSIDFNTTNGTPTGQATIRIETDNGGNPSGTLVDPNATKDFTPTEDAWNDITFDTPFFMEAGSGYWITITSQAQSGGNYWIVGRSTTDVYDGGAANYSSNGNWVGNRTYDLTFKVWEGQETPPESTSTIASVGDFTSQCITQNEYSGSNLTTSTTSCYSPIKVQLFYLIDFGFFIAVFSILWLVFRKIL